jgi:sensor domain CHASE-containing protein
VGETTFKSADRAISLDICSKTYRPFVVVSLIAVVFVVLITPFTRNATTAIIRMQATASVTIISTSVKATLGGFLRTASLSPLELFPGEIMGPP